MNSEKQINIFAKFHKKGEVVSGYITKNAPETGLFVELICEVTGIVRLVDIDWCLPPLEAISHYLVGDKIEVIIISVSLKKKKVLLGIKQIKPDPRLGDTIKISPNPKLPLKPLSSSASY